MIADEYAKALFLLAKEENKVSEFDAGFKIINGLVKNNNDFIKLMSSYMINKDDKKNILSEVSSKIDELFYNFLCLLIDKNRFALFSAISEAYYELWNLDNDVINILVQSSIELDIKSIEKIKKAMEVIYPSKKIIVDNRIDESLIGGVKILCQNEELDISVLKQLNDLKDSLWKG